MTKRQLTIFLALLTMGFLASSVFATEFPDARTFTEDYEIWWRQWTNDSLDRLLETAKTEGHPDRAMSADLYTEWKSRLREYEDYLSKRQAVARWKRKIGMPLTPEEREAFEKVGRLYGSMVEAPMLKKFPEDLRREYLDAKNFKERVKYWQDESYRLTRRASRMATYQRMREDAEKLAHHQELDRLAKSARKRIEVVEQALNSGLLDSQAEAEARIILQAMKNIKGQGVSFQLTRIKILEEFIIKHQVLSKGELIAITDSAAAKAAATALARWKSLLAKINKAPDASACRNLLKSKIVRVGAKLLIYIGPVGFVLDAAEAEAVVEEMRIGGDLDPKIAVDVINLMRRSEDEQKPPAKIPPLPEAQLLEIDNSRPDGYIYKYRSPDGSYYYWSNQGPSESQWDEYLKR